MKRVIRGRRYDTTTAQKLAECEWGQGPSDFSYFTEELYRKQTGEFFLYGKGGPASRYAKYDSFNGCHTQGEDIRPLTLEEAKGWAESNLDGDEYEKIFGAVEEDFSKKTISCSLPVKTIEKLKNKAVESGKSASEIITELINKM